MLEIKLEPGYSPDPVDEGGGGGGSIAEMATPSEGVQCVSPRSNSIVILGGGGSTGSAPVPASTAPSTDSEEHTNLDSASAQQMNVYILPKPLDQPCSQHMACLKSTTNLHPEFPLDPASNLLHWLISFIVTSFNHLMNCVALHYILLV